MKGPHHTRLVTSINTATLHRDVENSKSITIVQYCQVMIGCATNHGLTIHSNTYEQLNGENNVSNRQNVFQRGIPNRLNKQEFEVEEHLP